MKKRDVMFSLAVALTLFACVHTIAPSPSPGPSVVTSPIPVPATSPSVEPSPDTSPYVTPSVTSSPVVSHDEQVPRITVGTITGASDAEVKMIRAGELFANQKLAGACFKQWVLAARYTENNGMTQQQIWDLMASHPVSVDVEMYTGSWKANHIYKTVGYENDPWDGVVHMNRYFVNASSDRAQGQPIGYMVADNLWHEAEGHSQGFHHFGVKATSDPYGMNYAGEGCSQAQQMQNRGGKAYRPPGIRLEVRHTKKHK